jgi:hypothetical protein
MRRTRFLADTLAFATSTLLLLAPQAAKADMPVTFLEVEAVPGAFYGWGYNLTTQQFTSPCLNVNSSATYVSGQPDQNSAFEFTENTATIAAKSNLTVNAALKILGGGTTYAAGNKTSVAGGSESSTYSQTLFASAYRYNAPQFLDLGQVTFKPGVAALVASPGGMGQFKQQCGDAFVIGIQKGREFVGTASIVKQDLKSWTKFANDTNASAKGAWGEVSAEVNIAKEMEQAFGSQNIKVQTYSTGSSQGNPTRVTELEDYFKSFLNSPGQESMVRLVVAPYNLVEGYPWENPLKGTSKEDYIGMMVVALWELRAAIRDANFVLSPETANMFALGRGSQTRTNRIAYIRQQRESWQQEYDMLLSAAQQCDQDFSDRCKALAEYYDRHRNLTAQRHAVLPERYLSDCYQNRLLTDFSRLTNDLKSRNFATPVRGDSETSGSPSRVVAQLRFRPDQRQMKADLSVAKIQWKRGDWRGMPVEVRSNAGESGWALQSQAVVFDLDNPAQFGLGQENLRQCTWDETGLAVTPVPAPPAADYFQRFGFSQATVHGLVDGITGRDPRGQQHFGNGQGALEHIACEVDRKGKDDNMQCLELGVRNVRLVLSSSQDVAADSWAKPAPPQLPTALAAFHNRQNIVPVRHAQQFGQFARILAPTEQKALATAQTQKATAAKSFRAAKFQLPPNQLQLINNRLKLAPAMQLIPPAQQAPQAAPEKKTLRPLRLPIEKK